MEKELLKIYADSVGAHNRKLSIVCCELVKKVKSKIIKRINGRVLALRVHTERLYAELRVAIRRKQKLAAARYLLKGDMYQLKIQLLDEVRKNIVLQSKMWQMYFVRNVNLKPAQGRPHGIFMQRMGFVEKDQESTLAAQAIIKIAMDGFSRYIEPSFAALAKYTRRHWIWLGYAGCHPLVLPLPINKPDDDIQFPFYHVQFCKMFGLIVWCETPITWLLWLCFQHVFYVCVSVSVSSVSSVYRAHHISSFVNYIVFNLLVTNVKIW